MKFKMMIEAASIMLAAAAFGVGLFIFYIGLLALTVLVLGLIGRKEELLCKKKKRLMY